MKSVIVVIGLGSMGKRRIRLLRYIDKTIRILGVDCNQSRKDEVTTLYGIECYDSIENIDGWEITIAFIATSPITHGLLINQCLEKGWHIFTEINLVTDYYEENMRLAEEKGLTLFLSSTPIYRSEMVKIREILGETKEKLNYIYHIGQYLPDWHPWESINDFFVSNKRTNGCREIFAIELPWMVKVFGQIRRVNAIGNKLTSLTIDYRDSYLVQVEHENGNSGIMAVDIVCREPIRKLEIYGETTYITWEGRPDTLYYKNLETKRMEQVEGLEYVHEQNYGDFINEHAYIEEIKAFFRVLDGAECEYDFEQDKKVLGIIDEIEQE